MTGPLRLALVGGPMYDGLYDLIPENVEVVVHADHPTLNREVAARLAAGERLDVISTHGKYAPSQAEWLRPLDQLVAPEVIDALAPRAVELCRYRRELICLPRNIDVRVLWWRRDRAEAAPATWDEVETGPLVFGFTGRESGLFGLFYELVAGAGGALFDAEGRPTLTTPEAIGAVGRLVRLAARAPADLPDWHYDQVDDALLDGRIDAAAAWPGGTARIRASALVDRLAPAPYPGGLSYSGCHAWAIPTTCGDVPAAVALVERLASYEAGRLDAEGGSIPAHGQALAEHRPADAIDAERLRITAATVAAAMLTYPPLPRFPEVEDAGWESINEALRQRISPEEATRRMQAAAVRALEVPDDSGAPAASEDPV